MNKLVAISLLGLAACGALAGGPPGDAGNNDGAGACNIQLAFDPNPAHAGSGNIERVTANIVAPGVLSYLWTISLAGQNIPTTALGDGFAVDFPIENPGEYAIALEVTSDARGEFCTTHQQLNVLDPDANLSTFRVRITPPPSANAPPIEQNIQVTGGADQAINIAFPQIAQTTGTVSYSGAPIIAYVRATPPGSSTFVEAFSDARSGQYGPLDVLGGPQDLLFVPAVPGPAPTIVHWSPGMSTFFALDAGTPVSGKVSDSAGAGIANAKVQLVLGHTLPSTLTTTNPDGTFTVQASTSDAGLLQTVTVEVTPPASTGLPRLTATSGFDVTSPINVSYAAIATRNLGGVPVVRGGSPIANAQVVVAGSLVTGAATIAGIAADNTIRVAGTTGSDGKIAGTLAAPAAPVSVVVTLATGEVEVIGVDLTTGVPATLTIPAATVAAGTVTDANDALLGGVFVELVPSGALAIAGALSVQATTAADGSYTASLAASGTYDLRVSDFQGRGPLFLAGDVTPAGVGNIKLAASLHVNGIITLPSLSVVPGASVQFLCGSCTGLDAARPIAESSTDVNGIYHVGIPDPGTH